MKHLSGAPLKGSPTKIRLSWKDLQGTNALTYYKNVKITAVKRFYRIDPRLPTGKK
jgi:hypothetical protein